MVQLQRLRPEQAMEELICTYDELNGPIDILDEAPSPLEFMRFVAKNRPFVVRAGCSTFPALQKWKKTEYLLEKMKGRFVQIAKTPHGNADAAIHRVVDGKTYFGKPQEKDERFCDFFHSLLSADHASSELNSSVKYSQAQNDNLREEYLPLFSDVEPHFPWASIALNKKPEAINIWWGNRASVTALHRDNYENIFAQIIGVKHFVLLPPLKTACVNETFLPSATYNEHLLLTPDVPEEAVPCE